MVFIIINAGSSSIKYKAYTEHLSQLFSGLIEGIGESQGQWHQQFATKISSPHNFSTHKEAFQELAIILKTLLKDKPLLGIGHRVVHGGKKYFEPSIITTELLATLQELSLLAPIHNPINIEGIIFAQKYFPNILQVAVFDTGFHHSMPERVYRYAIEQELSDKFHIRRYGFHGINHGYIAAEAAVMLHKPLEKCDFITLHLGNGVSACLIKNGLSFDTSMGMTPLSGLIMGTRCGDVDPNIALYLQKRGLSIPEVESLFNKNSGLMGIAKDNDMRRLCERALAGDTAAILAIDMYVYVIQKIIGAYLTQTSHLNALIFSGGVGENSAYIRNKIIQPLGHLGFSIKADISLTASAEQINDKGFPILVIRGDEEKYIAKAVLKIYLS